MDGWLCSYLSDLLHVPYIYLFLGLEYKYGVVTL